MSNERPDAAMACQPFAVIIALIVCGWPIAERKWFGSTAAIIIAYFEARSIMQSTPSAPRQ